MLPRGFSAIVPILNLTQTGKEGKYLLLEIQRFLVGEDIKSSIYETQHKNKLYRTKFDLRIVGRGHVVAALRNLAPFLRVKKVQAQDLLRFLRLYPSLNHSHTLYTEIWKDINRKRRTQHSL